MPTRSNSQALLKNRLRAFMSGSDPCTVLRVTDLPTSSYVTLARREDVIALFFGYLDPHQPGFGYLVDEIHRHHLNLVDDDGNFFVKLSGPDAAFEIALAALRSRGARAIELDVRAA